MTVPCDIYLCIYFGHGLITKTVLLVSCLFSLHRLRYVSIQNKYYTPIISYYICLFIQYS